MPTHSWLLLLWYCSLPEQNKLDIPTIRAVRVLQWAALVTHTILVHPCSITAGIASNMKNNVFAPLFLIVTSHSLRYVIG